MTADYSLADCRHWPSEWWFPPSARSREARAAIAICHTCPLKVECAAEHRHERWGIWGGEWRDYDAKYRRMRRVTA